MYIKTKLGIRDVSLNVDLSELADELLLELWSGDEKPLEKFLKNSVNVSEITYFEARKRTVDYTMLHGLEAEKGVKCRIKEKYNNTPRTDRPTLIYLEYPLLTKVDNVYLIGKPDLVLFYPLRKQFLMIPVEKKSGRNGPEMERKHKIAIEQATIYALMLNSPYFLLQLEKYVCKNGVCRTVTHEAYKITHTRFIIDEITRRVKCVYSLKKQKKRDFSVCKTEDLTQYVMRM